MPAAESSPSERTTTDTAKRGRRRPHIRNGSSSPNHSAPRPRLLERLPVTPPLRDNRPEHGHERMPRPPSQSDMPFCRSSSWNGRQSSRLPMTRIAILGGHGDRFPPHQTPASRLGVNLPG